MTAPGPLAAPLAWDLVADGYAAEAFDHFARYAADALRLADVRPGEVVLDVAAGPGSLALQAAAAGARVTALDFSAEMLGELRARAAAQGLAVAVHEGDGQHLPFADGAFDAAFSMFGLMFFPDRARGLAELARVLRPGGRAVVSGWQPAGRVPILVAIFTALRTELPDLPFGGDAKPPLCDPADFEAELGAAGFEVAVHEAVHAVEAPSLAEFWRVMRRSMAPLVLLEHKLGAERFEVVAGGIRRRLEAEFGPGPVRVAQPAWLGLGRKPG